MLDLTHGAIVSLYDGACAAGYSQLLRVRRPSRSPPAQPAQPAASGTTSDATHAEKVPPATPTSWEGEEEFPPAKETPPAQPPAPPPARSGVMARRWSVALALGSETLRSKLDDAPRVTFATLELAGRFPDPAVDGSRARLGRRRCRTRRSRPVGSTPTFDIDFVRNVRSMSTRRSALARYRLPGKTEATSKSKAEARFGLAVASNGGSRRSSVSRSSCGSSALARTRRSRYRSIADLDYEMSRYGVSGLALALNASFYF